MDKEGNADKENTKISKNLAQLSGLKGKVKELCKLSQEKHILRMVLARSKIITQRKLPGSLQKIQASKVDNKEVLEDNTTTNQKELKTVSQKIKSAPRERRVMEIAPANPAHKVKSQGFPFKKIPPKLISLEQKCKHLKKATVFYSSTPKSNLKTEPGFQNISNIKECKRSAIRSTDCTDTNSGALLNSKVATKKVLESPVKNVLEDKAFKNHSVISNESKNIEKSSVKTFTDGCQKINKNTQEAYKKTPVTKIPKVAKTPSIKTTKPSQNISKLSPKKEMAEGRKACFNPSYLTSYELKLDKNGDKVVDSSETEDNSSTLYETCNNESFNINEESPIKHESSNKRKSLTFQEIFRASEEMSNKGLKNSEWRRISSSYPSHVSETSQGSSGIIGPQKWQSEITDLMTASSSLSATKYTTPHSFIVNEDSEINLSVGDVSIEQIDVFKLNTEKESDIKIQENSKKLNIGKSTALVNKSTVYDKKSPKNKSDIGKSVSEPNNLLTQYQDGSRSQTWLNFAKLFAENVIKAREQRKLREMDFGRPTLNLAGDAKYLEEK